VYCQPSQNANHSTSVCNAAEGREVVEQPVRELRDREKSRSGRRELFVRDAGWDGVAIAKEAAWRQGHRIRVVDHGILMFIGSREDGVDLENLALTNAAPGPQKKRAPPPGRSVGHPPEWNAL